MVSDKVSCQPQDASRIIAESAPILRRPRAAPRPRARVGGGLVHMQGEVVEGQRRVAGARGSQALGKQGERGRVSSPGLAVFLSNVRFDRKTYNPREFITFVRVGASDDH